MILIVARLDEEPESNVGLKRLLRTRKRAQDAGVQLIVQLDDLVAPFSSDEDGQLIPRLLKGVQTNYRTKAFGTPRSLTWSRNASRSISYVGMGKTSVMWGSMRSIVGS